MIFLGIIVLTLATCRKESTSSDLPPPYPIANELELITALPSTISESSGLAWIDNQLWTINDSGNPAELYEVATASNSLLQTLALANSENIDWEALTFSDSILYIADFGNNSGTRENMTLYALPREELQNDQLINIESITFEITGRPQNPEPEQHNFNFEALIHFDGSLYIFSKNHLNLQTTIYQLQLEDPSQAEIVDSFNTDGLITDAALHPDGNLLCLLGYNRKDGAFAPFVWIFSRTTDSSDFPNPRFMNQQRVDLPITTQTEGITHFENDRFFISSEAENGSGANLYLLDVAPWR